MKKLLLASLITATSFGASASVLTFDDTSFGGSGNVSLYGIDFDDAISSVTQSDGTGGSGDITGTDNFSEFGDALAVSFDDGSVLPVAIDPAYEVFYQYAFTGMATLVPSGIAGIPASIFVSFNVGTSNLFVETLGGNAADGILNGTNASVASLSLASGSCSISTGTESGGCELDLDVNFASGLFFDTNGDDLSLNNTVKATLNLTAEEVNPTFNYQADPNNPGQFLPQTFDIIHDGNLSFSYDVPEPASIAILGLGLLGFAGARRRKA
jgi:hypothetical protein